ncbi:hypothetical protein [Asticcacaulis sp. 201]|uniref:hypothetical protein n=1 Tax=Asticcacaulis sp. 201 TaxID=3028787 RepID=UPI002915D3A4|nr:hypothetical protein [Asticcacaulis sp. 201]MDV6333148.1 hypothetical protein [Asticcacaulis sp. 201]
MTRPTPMAYLFGNPLSLLAMLATTLLVGYAALNGQTNGWLAILCLFALGYCAKSAQQLATYARWKREWDAMNGQPPKAPIFARMKWLRYVLGSIAWIIAACMASAAGHHPNVQLAAGLFWLGTALGIGVLLFRMAKRIRQNVARTIPQKQFPVSVCVNVPLRSVPVSDSYRALPEYCTRLFGG